ncbi:hypothetical protein Q9L42_011545 [Methylomarinum sp. Ch1-1]|uniref:Uncharacterized protein n=1 Tax=Methylomarinum roseum TaxID=3067653 RepID=A0AAU7NPX2_9GAMM|nr:hypothetical protein [Methylomarinum sp. Ch1-1]MDP4521068.1 hypothetical protein [Methylomarinum sp. Ch1-1]
MLRPLRILFFYLAAPPCLLAILVFFAIEQEPLSKTHRKLSQSDIQRAKQIINTSSNYIQRVRTIELNEADLNIASNYLLNHLIESSTEITLQQDALHFKLSLTLPDNLFGPYLNITFNLSKMYGYPAIKALKIGRIEIADEFAGQLIESIIKHTPLKQYYILAAQHISNIQIQPDHLVITYLTTFKDAANNATLLENKSYQSLIFYQQQINQIILKHDPAWRLSLADIMQPLFLAAYQRSTTANAVTENRAVLIAISSYVNKEELSSYLPINLTMAKHYPVYLYKRIDMAKHFVASAALAATGASNLAHLLGQEKELSDAQSGSGFSFIDLAGDRAGLEFGKTATASPQSARKLQKAMHDIEDYRAFMPDVRDLPENMTHQQFQSRYGSVYSEAYQDMLKQIDERISALPIYQNQ